MDNKKSTAKISFFLVKVSNVQHRMKSTANTGQIWKCKSQLSCIYVTWFT